jgi:ribosomal protein L22
MAAAVDPVPHARKRWQRKMLIRDIRGRNRMNKTTKILRTERFSLCKSEMFKTSVKKLGPLARQIAGKPIEEAIVQMRFSKKKVAADVKKHLEYARDEAIVRKGMGLGMVKPKVAEDGAEAETEAETAMKPIVVEDRNGKRRTVTDLSSIYVDQAWVGRGRYNFGRDYRARGQINILRLPYTSESLLISPSLTPSNPLPLFSIYVSPTHSL